MSSTAASKEGRSKPMASKSVARSPKATLQYPVGKTAHSLKADKYSKRVGTTPVYLSTILECFAAKMLELVGNATKDNKKNYIVPRHIELAVRNEKNLSKLLGTVTIANGGNFAKHSSEPVAEEGWEREGYDWICIKG